MACVSCADTATRNLPTDTHSRFGRALTFGIGGAIVGLILYSAVGIITGLEIGYVSLAVGYIVGKAVMKGSAGIGGRRYQIAAVLLTYAAVSMAQIPIAISLYVKEGSQTKNARSNETNTGAAPAASNPDQPTAEVKPMNLGKALANLALIGLASPFLGLIADPLHGIIGLIILLVGIRIAWQITATRTAVVVDGPF